MKKESILVAPRLDFLLISFILIILSGYLWLTGWERPYSRAADPKFYFVIGIVALILELKTVTVSEKHLMLWWLFIPIRIVDWKNISSITIVQKTNGKSDVSLRVLITVVPCVYRVDMALTAAEFARQHLIKGIFFRIPKKNPEGTIRKLKEFCPHLEIPYITQ